MRFGLLFLLGASMVIVQPAWAQEPAPAADLSLDSLLNLPVSAAAKYAQTTREAAASVSIITADEIRRYGYRSLAEVMAAVPGFYTTDDRLFVTVGARGFSRPNDFNNRILVMVDGNTVNDNAFGAAALGPELPLEMEAIERVEVVRGPGSALYGTGAVFAIVNVITRAGQQVDGVRVSASSGSFGHREVSGVAGAQRGKLDVMLSALWSESDGQRFDFPELTGIPGNSGVADRQNWDRRTGLLGTASLGGFRFMGRVSERTYGLLSPGLADGRGYINASNVSTELRYEAELTPRLSWMARGYLHWFGVTGISPLAPTVDYGFRLASSARGTETAVRWDAASYSRLTIGVQYESHPMAIGRQTMAGAPLPSLSRPNSVVSLYAQEQLTVGRHLTLLGGLRGDFYSDGPNPVVPRVGAIVQAGRGATFKLLYGQAIRVPSVFEVALTSSSPSAPTLDPERVHTTELVWEQRITPWLYGSASGFVYDGDNMIDQVVIDSAPVYANASKAHAKGAEVALQTALPNGLRGYASFEFNTAHDERTDLRLTNSPAHAFKLGVTRPVLGIDVGTELRHEAGRRNPHGGETDTYWLANLTLTRRAELGRNTPLGAVGQRLDFSFQVRNLFNATYYVPATLIVAQSRFPQDGRTFLARIGYRF